MQGSGWKFQGSDPCTGSRNLSTVASYLVQETPSFLGSSYRRVLEKNEAVLFLRRIFVELVQVGGEGVDLRPLQTPTSIAPPRLCQTSCILCTPAFGVRVGILGLGFRARGVGLVDWSVGFWAWSLECGV